jgi:peptidyl-prolyl cis-trans isomerase D
MLNALRRIASTWFGKILGAFLIVGLAGFGISNVILDLGTNTLARVGDEEITTRAFQRVYQQQLNQMAQTLGYVPTNEQALQFGIPSAVISRLASDSAINQLAVKMSLGVSDSRLAKLVREDPSFSNVLGAFDRATFEQVLRQNGFTEAEYIDLQTRASRRQQMALGLFGGSPTSTTAQGLLHHYAGDKRIVDYFILTAANIPAVTPPSEDELRKYLTDKQADYRTKEARTAAVVLLSPDTLASQYTPTEEQVKAEYDRTKDQLVKIEKRQVQQVTLPDEAAAKAFEDQKAAGATFAAALAASGLTATDFGLVAKAELSDSALADAAFGLTKEGDFTIIAGIGTKRVVGVTKIEAGGQISYEDARTGIASKLALDAAKAAYVDIQDQVEELRAAFKPLKEIADRYKLPLVDVTLTGDGDALAAVTELAPENRAKVATAIFAAEQGKLTPAVSLGSNSNLFFELSKVEAARDLGFIEVRDKIVAALLAERTKAALEAEAKAIVADLDSGTSFGVVASQHGATTTTTPAFGRNGDGTPLINQQVATAVFLGGPNSHGWTLNGNGDTVLYSVKSTEKAAGDPDDRTKKFNDDATRDALYAEFIDGLRNELGIKVNNQALTTVLGLDTAQ